MSRIDASDILATRLMKQAEDVASLSNCKIVKVGATIRDYDGKEFSGYNGEGFIGDELEEKYLDEERGWQLRSKPGVIHAEAAAIAEACRSGTFSLQQSLMVVTMAPCINCAALIALTGVKMLYYRDPWWDKAAIELLEKNNVTVRRIK